MSSTASLLKVKKAENVSEKKVTGSIASATVDAGDSLLRAIKAKMLREHGKIDFVELRRKGYSETLIRRLKSL